MDESTTSSTTTSGYGRRKKQVGKPEMYMMTALWMEYSPWAPTKENPKDINVVGSVFVLPNDRVLSADCSRVRSGMKKGIVHGAVQALIKYPDQVKGCTVYLSRKPCANCVKLLVQAAVAKVYYLPLKPEKESDESDEREENKSVDALFRVSPVSQSIFIPDITQEDIDELEKSKNDYGKTPVDIAEINKMTKELGWADDEWKKNIEEHLSWEEFTDKEIKYQSEADMKMFFEWFYKATWCTGNKKEMNFTVGDEKPDEEFSRLASHLSRLAQMLSNRTDDPNRGVGCVIESGDEIISIGWNGFPSKALYGNHPRGSTGTKDTKVHQKYPHVIHAEQNALLCRNRRDIDDATVYVNQIPYDECMPMLYQLAVKIVVLPAVKREEKKNESVFYNLLKEKKITVYTQCQKIPN